jgi:hypothetical protein
MEDRACFRRVSAIGWGIAAAVIAAHLLVACIDDHHAEECQYLGTCPLPDAGDDGDGSSQ